MSWTTTDELAFIAGLGLHHSNGTHSRLATPHDERRLHLLHGYLEGLKLRVNMTGLDRAALEARVKQLIEQLNTAKNKESK